MESSIKEQSIAGFKWNAIGHITAKVVNLALGLLIARMLMPDDYGVIGMLTIFMAIAQAFVDSGFGNALIRKSYRTETDCATAFYFNIAIGIVSYGILFLLAPYIANFYRMPILRDVVRLLSLNIVINSMGIVPRALRSIAVDFKSLAYASVSAAMMSGMIGLYMAYCGYGVWALVWQQVMYALMNVVVIWVLARWVPRWVYSWQSFMALFSYGSKLLASRLLHVVYTNASNLVIGKWYTPAELGYYDRGFHIAALPSLKLGDVLYQVTFPILAKQQNDNERLVHVYQQYVAMTSMVIFFIMTLLAGVAKPLILIVLTEKWIGVVPFLQVLCLAFMFDSICRLNNNMLFVKGWSGLFFKLEIIKKVIVTPIFLLAIPLGVMAICCVAVVHTVVDIACSTYYLRKLLGVRWIQYVSVARYFSLSVIACAPAFLLCQTVVQTPWMSLTTGVSMALGLYLWFLHNDENMRECLQILKKAIHAN